MYFLRVNKPNLQQITIEFVSLPSLSPPPQLGAPSPNRPKPTIQTNLF